VYVIIEKNKLFTYMAPLFVLILLIYFVVITIEHLLILFLY